MRPEEALFLSSFCTPSNGPGTAFDAPAAAVWRAPTDAETLTSLGISSNISLVVGHRFRFFPAPGADPATTIETEMIEADEPSRFGFTLFMQDLDEPITVSVTLDSVGDGSATRFRMAQTDASGKSCRASAGVLGRHRGQRFFEEALPRYLAQNQQRPGHLRRSPRTTRGRGNRPSRVRVGASSYPPLRQGEGGDVSSDMAAASRNGPSP